MQRAGFGSCCTALSDSIHLPTHSAFRVDDLGVLYMAVGYNEFTDGPDWLEQPVIYCPFCGTKLQDLGDIRKRLPGKSNSN